MDDSTLPSRYRPSARVVVVDILVFQREENEDGEVTQRSFIIPEVFR